MSFYGYTGGVTNKDLDINILVVIAHCRGINRLWSVLIMARHVPGQ